MYVWCKIPVGWVYQEWETRSTCSLYQSLFFEDDSEPGLPLTLLRPILILITGLMITQTVVKLHNVSNRQPASTAVRDPTEH